MPRADFGRPRFPAAAIGETFPCERRGMLELELALSFACCRCGRPMQTTLRCEGIGLADPEALALASLPCPSCCETIHVIFAPDNGEIREVLEELEIVRYMVPEPSIN